MSSSEAKIFAVRVTTGQELNAAMLIDNRVRTNNLQVLSILVPGQLKGYVFIEALGPHIVEEAISGIKHVRSKIPGKVSYSDVEKYLVTKPVIEELDVGYLVEVTGGPFKGMRGRIIKVNRLKHEATLELLEATFHMPITVNADYLKLIDKETS
jgi:transcriptional antiterminator NusG